jgi:hypothetical protein
MNVRRAVFTVLAVLVVPAVLLGALEAVLRVAGVGDSRSFAVKERRDGAEAWIRNPAFARLFFEPQLAREAHPFALAVPKPAGEVRVFLLGASAANGIPEPAYGLARQLELLLRERHPDARLEVIDVAITATNSHVTRRIAEACARMEPDLFVLYLGNNEVVGPYGPGTVFAPLLKSRGLIALDLAVRSSRRPWSAPRAGRGRRSGPGAAARSDGPTGGVCSTRRWPGRASPRSGPCGRPRRGKATGASSSPRSAPRPRSTSAPSTWRPRMDGRSRRSARGSSSRSSFVSPAASAPSSAATPSPMRRGRITTGSR